MRNPRLVALVLAGIILAGTIAHYGIVVPGLFLLGAYVGWRIKP